MHHGPADAELIFYGLRIIVIPPYVQLRQIDITSGRSFKSVSALFHAWIINI